MAGHPWDVELPAGVSEDEVAITAEHLSNARVVLTAETLKHAIEKPAEPDDEPTDLDNSDDTKPDDEPADEELV